MNSFYIAIRRAGFDFAENNVKKGEEYFDNSSLAHSEGTSRGMAESHGKMRSTSLVDYNYMCPIVRIARVNIVEIDK